MFESRFMTLMATPLTGTRFAAKAEQALSRRAFLRGLLATLAAAQLDPLFRSILQDRTLMAEAAELSGDAITVDLHCHPNLSSGRRLAEFDSDVPDNMRAGGLDAGVFAVRGDHGTLRRSPTGHYTESRKPTIGELFQSSQDQLDKLLKASKAERSAWPHRRQISLKQRSIASPAPFWRSKAAILSRAISRGSNFFMISACACCS